MRLNPGFCALAAIVGVVAAVTMSAQTITPDEATLRLFPPETNGLVFIDAAGLRSAALIQEVLQEPRYPSELAEFIAATGFKPDQDIDAITVARVAPKRVVAIVRARFDPFKIRDYLRDENVPNEAYLGRVLYKSRDMSFSVIDDLIVAGHMGAVKQVIDRLAAPAPNAAQNTGLTNMIREIEAGNHVWAVGEMISDVLSSERLPFPPQVSELLQALTSGTYQMRVDHDVHIRAVGNFSTSESARSTSDLLRGLVAVLRFSSTQNVDLMRLLDGVRIEDSGPSLTVRVDAPGDLIKKLPAVRRQLNLAD